MSGPKLGDFEVEFLGVEYPDYFQGYGVSFSKYENCTYGIGNTEEEALDDCIEMFAQSTDIDCTELVERLIRAVYGKTDDSRTANEFLGFDDDCADETLDEDSDCADGHEESKSHDYEESAFFHIGIKWNEIND